MSASSGSSAASGSAAVAASGGSMNARPPADCTASTYARDSRNASRSHTVQRACSTAVQMPIAGLRMWVPYPGRSLRIRRMAATLPELETVTLRRGASNGAELRIVLDRPERMNAWDKQLGLDLRAAVELAARDDA